MPDDRPWPSTAAQLAAVLDGVADGVVALRPDGRPRFVNDTAARMLGFGSAAEAMTAGADLFTARVDTLDESMHPLPAERHPARRALRGEEPPEALIGTRISAVAYVRWNLVKAASLPDPSGEASAIVILRDVTAARLTEHALRAANEALRAIVRASPLPIIVADVDTTIRLWNPAAERIFGWAEEEVVGRLAPTIPEERQDESRRLIDGIGTGREIPPLETKRRRRDGTIIDVTLWATSFASPEGRPQVLAILADATEARRAAAERERLLRQIETERNFLRVVLEQLPVGARVADANGEVIFANRRAEEIWDPATGEAVTGFGADGRAYGPREWPIFRAVRDGAPVVDEEVEIVRRDATHGTLMVSAAPVRDEEGRIVGAASILSDITERKRAERSSRFLSEATRLLTSSLEYRETLGAMARLTVPWLADWCAVHLIRRGGRIDPVAIAHHDPEKQAWAEATARRYRPDPSAPIGLGSVIRTGVTEVWDSISESVLRDAASGDEESAALLAEMGILAALIVPIVGREGMLGAITFLSTDSARRFDAMDRALGEELGRRAGLAVENAILFRGELEARQAAEKAARRTATLQRFAEALSEAPTQEAIAQLVVDMGLRELEADAGSIALVRGEEIAIVGATGYRPEVAARWETFPIGADLPIARAVREKRIVSYSSLEELFASFPAMASIQGWTHQSFAAVPLLVESRAVGAIGLSFRERRRFDADEVDLILAIARQCAQALERARLLEAERTAREEAEAANRAKDEFLATLSHELRTPMTATLGWARMLTMLNVDEETLRVAIDSIFRSTLAQARIVDDLLDVARIVTGKMKIDPRPMLLRPLILDALESVRAAADARSIAIDLDLPEPAIPILGDPDRLRQVVWNLLSNAIKFTPTAGHVRVAIRRGGESATLTVADDGQGIRPDLLPFVFDRFRQGDSSSSRTAAGLGLGLSIVRHLVELHGGSVAAASDGEGKGATFTVTLPLAATPPLEIGRPAAIMTPVLAGRSLLIVDDEGETLAMIASVLRQLGAEVRTASCADEAISALRTARPHVVLSDLAMPGVDGFALLEAVRKEGHADLPFVAITAYGRQEDRERALAAGFAAYVRKPLDPDALLESIRSVLAGE